MKLRIVDFEAEGYVQLSTGAWVIPFDSLSTDYKDFATAYAWDMWTVWSCAERHGGHHWWLDWDTDNGLDLHCRHCPAGVDELYPDGQDLIFASLPVLGMDEPLVIENGMVTLTSLFVYYSGPVKAWVEEEHYRGGPWGGEEWNAWVVVEAAS